MAKGIHPARRNKVEIEAEILRLKLKKIEILEREKAEREKLPHLHKYKFYKWAREVYESQNPEIFLVAANQLSKSSTAIRKNIELATNKSLWEKFWPGKTPNLFWYFYPNFQLATTEFETKWMEFLPKDKSCPVYGWDETYDKGVIQKITFNSGVILQFRAYSQKLIDIQAASVYHITADEEMPVQILPEIKARLNATDGYFLKVFTATLGQEYWKETMEPTSKATEKHSHALKKCVSLYDSMTYEDGSPSPWTKEKIERAKANCPTEAEVQRRVYGRFVRSEGLQYESFTIERNTSEAHPLPKDWYVYGAIDPGSGGQSGHPTGIVLLGVNPQYTKARVFRAWRGDGIATTSQDALNKFRELKRGLVPAMQIYDYSAKDFFMVASSQGENFIPANKDRESGIAIVNTLFKSGILSIQRGDVECEKLISELLSLGVGIDKRKAKDDLIDPLRYICKAIPWDFSQLELPESLREAPKVEVIKSEGEKRRDYWEGRGERWEGKLLGDKADSVEEEFDYWNELQDSFD